LFLSGIASLLRAMSFSQIITHPGGAHKDEFLACSLLLAKHRVPIFRREPIPADLENPATAVVDVGGKHDPELGNFDHHQFPADSPPLCALSLVLQHLGLYEDARRFCGWLEAAEMFDTRGPIETGKWLNVTRESMERLTSPIDVTLLRRFAASSELHPGQPVWEIMAMVGEDLIGYLKSVRERLDFVAAQAQWWEIDGREVLFLPRVEGSPDDLGGAIGRYLGEIGKDETVVGTVYPDRRGTGYGLSRHRDNPFFNFTRITDEADTNFAHARGFVAKTRASDPERLKALLLLARDPSVS
jgi:Uncharacterised protein family (UPF0160)